MKKFLAIAMLVCIIALTACTPAARIVGEWKSQSKVLGVTTETKYVFNKDGTGHKTLVVEIPFTYTVKGNKLTITTNVIGIDVGTTEYTVSFEGKTMLLTHDGDTIKLEKVN